jgi:hypothetical protein
VLLGGLLRLLLLLVLLLLLLLGLVLVLVLVLVLGLGLVQLHCGRRPGHCAHRLLSEDSAPITCDACGRIHPSAHEKCGASGPAPKKILWPRAPPPRLGNFSIF